jgi:hypothetical protein
MPQKKYKSEEIVAKLWQVDVLVLQGRSVAEPVRWIGVTQFTCYRWRKEFGGLKTDRLVRLKELLKDRARGSPLVREPLASERFRKAVSDLTLEKLIMREAWLARHWWRAFSSLAGPFARRRWGSGNRAMNAA